MKTQQKPNETRRKLAWIFSISIGILLGFFIKKLHVGLMLGVIIGLLYRYGIRNSLPKIRETNDYSIGIIPNSFGLN